MITIRDSLGQLSFPTSSNRRQLEIDIRNIRHILEDILLGN